MTGLISNALINTPGNFEKNFQTVYYNPSSNCLHQSFHLKRWIKYSSVKYQYQYSPMENEIYQIYNSVIVQWFGLDIQHKTISLIPYTNSKCTIIPPDAYPIN